MFKHRNDLKLPKIEDSIARMSASPPKNGFTMLDSPYRKSIAYSSPLKPKFGLNTDLRGSVDNLYQNRHTETNEDHNYGNFTNRQNIAYKKLDSQRDNNVFNSQLIAGFNPHTNHLALKPVAPQAQYNKLVNNMNAEYYQHEGGLPSIVTKSPRLDAGAKDRDLKDIMVPRFHTEPNGDDEKIPVNKEPKTLLPGLQKNYSPRDVTPRKLGTGQFNYPNFAFSEEPNNSPAGNKLSNNSKINVDLIVAINEKISKLFECANKTQDITPSLKEYLEVVDSKEAIQVDTVFFDTRVRRNLKTYIMLERTSGFILLFLLSDEFKSQDPQTLPLVNICNYLYSNFLNFVDTVITKMELQPRLYQLSDLEKLKQIARKKAFGVDRSFSLEQVNKMLIRILKTCVGQKDFNNKKTERTIKLELLIEKIEFGLMLNYNDELRNIFADIIQKYDIRLSEIENNPSIVVTGMDHNRPMKSDRSRPGQKMNGKSDSVPMTNMEPPKALLPPPVKKIGQENRPVYTLVLDMDETLIHFEEIAGKGKFFVRPYAEKFLKEMSEWFEIVIFTAGAQEYADKVLNILDPQNYITHRLYRQHLTLLNNYAGIVKDLTRLGRDMTKTLIIDNAPENFRFQQDNGLPITTWYNDPNDTELLEFMPFLKSMVLDQVEDVTVNIKKFKNRKRKKKY